MRCSGATPRKGSASGGTALPGCQLCGLPPRPPMDRPHEAASWKPRGRGTLQAPGRHQAGTRQKTDRQITERTLDPCERRGAEESRRRAPRAGQVPADLTGVHMGSPLRAVAGRRAEEMHLFPWGERQAARRAWQTSRGRRGSGQNMGGGGRPRRDPCDEGGQRH